MDRLNSSAHWRRGKSKNPDNEDHYLVRSDMSQESGVGIGRADGRSIPKAVGKVSEPSRFASSSEQTGTVHLSFGYSFRLDPLGDKRRSDGQR